MSEFGATFLILVALVSVGAAYIRSRLHEEQGLHERKRQDAEKVIETLKLLRDAPSVQRSRVLGALSAKFATGPVGYHPVLNGSDQWLDSNAAILTSLLTDDEGEHVVEQFFEYFTFPAGKQQQVLAWLGSLLQGGRSAVPAAVLQRLADLILTNGGMAEAEWFYRRTLEALRYRSADAGFKAFVLHAGRLSYAFKRADRRPTIYDEQAIANDITMCT